jgi:hypothetical protein
MNTGKATPSTTPQATIKGPAWRVIAASIRINTGIRLSAEAAAKLPSSIRYPSGDLTSDPLRAVGVRGGACCALLESGCAGSWDFMATLSSSNSGL